jgi:hypothetical protein
MSPQTKLRRVLALALAGGSLAIGVPAALAGGSDTRDGAATPDAGFVQDDRSGQNRPGDDCPERGGNEDRGGSGADDGATTTTPAI